ncbi:MAG: YceI family protein [bacterium]|nr:YceI family protein [bacterium]
MLRKYLVAGIVLLLATGFGFSAETYQIDTTHSSVSFTVSHMVVSKVRGNFNDFTGTLVWDEKDLSKSSLEASVKVESIDTRNDRRDGHLKGPDFFDVAKHPEITFKSSKITKEGEHLVAVGNLTMRGVSKEIKLPLKVLGKVKTKRGTKLGMEGFTLLNRKDFGVNWNRTMDQGGLAVGEQVTIEILLELNLKKEEAKK